MLASLSCLASLIELEDERQPAEPQCARGVVSEDVLPGRIGVAAVFAAETHG
jgi:hypothetical protein